MDNYLCLLGKRPHNAHSPIVQGNHPELDTSELLNDAGVQMYQSLIGSLQWAIQIGRFDIATAVMTLSRFRACPRQGHLDRVKHVIGCLSKFKHGVICIRTDKPDYSNIPKKEYDWFYTCYAGAREGIPEECPTPRGNSVVTTTYVDANLFHDVISRRSVTAVVHLLNMTPIDRYSKLQSTVETATFGSEYVAARTATEQILDLRLTLRHLGVPIDGPSFMFRDNKSTAQLLFPTPSYTSATMLSHATTPVKLLLLVSPAFITLLALLTLQISLVNTGDICTFGKCYALSCSGKVTPRQLPLRNSSLPMSSSREVKAG